MRSGSYTALALLAAHPAGRTLDQLAAALHPDTDKDFAVKRVRTDITTTRRVLRTATGRDEPMFIVYDQTTSRYWLDPDTVAVDLWQMLTAIDKANTAEDDMAALAALRQAAELYGGDFADGRDHSWAVDYATAYRHQILTVHARIAEILEADHPDQAVAALETAVELDPVNEELYQRIMRIHGRQQRPDAVRRTLRRLEERLADLGDAEPSQATRRVAERQLRPAAPTSGARP
jgi:DNA-binding SARP family transcriptional activator